MRKLSMPAILLAISGAVAIAQGPVVIQPGATYECPVVRARIKIFSCAGSGDADLCDVQTYFLGNPQSSRGKSSRQQVNSLLRFCHRQTADEAKTMPPMPPPAAAGQKKGIK
jgi:hypothetical protein